MANQQHLDLILQGTTVWNPWKEKQGPNFRPDLSGANLYRANLSEAKLYEANLSEADLSRANLWGANLSEADLSGANLYRADLSETSLQGASLSGANLSRANLSGADLSGACLSEAFLQGANLSDADLSRANLSRASLSGADLSRANLSDADFSDADLSGAKVGRTIFSGHDLRTVKGLVTLDHGGPSVISTDTLERSRGDLPEAFLRGAGLSDTFITYARSLVARPIEYYTCFISYSSHDQDFAERMYADLQSKGVRCWFAPEDHKIGGKFWHPIDESIRLYDKLLVVLSQHSVNSDWVEREVMAALEKEQQHKKLVLFPIKLDEEVMHTSLPWAADIRSSRRIGDFTAWKDHDAYYQKAFTHLLHDLQAVTSPQQVP